MNHPMQVAPSSLRPPGAAAQTQPVLAYTAERLEAATDRVHAARERLEVIADRVFGSRPKADGPSATGLTPAISAIARLDRDLDFLANALDALGVEIDRLGAIA